FSVPNDPPTSSFSVSAAAWNVARKLCELCELLRARPWKLALLRRLPPPGPLRRDDARLPPPRYALCASDSEIRGPSARDAYASIAVLRSHSNALRIARPRRAIRPSLPPCAPHSRWRFATFSQFPSPRAFL